MPATGFALRLAVLACGATATAQSFAYPDFTATTGLSLNGGAAVSGTALRVATNTAPAVGSVWRSLPVPVAEGFETTFDFAMSSAPEGLAFVIHGAPAGALALGGTAWGIGYGFGANTAPISNCLAIEMDAIQDGFLNDTGANELSIHTVGALGNSENEGVSIGRVLPTVDMSNGQVRKLRVRYVPGTGGQPGTLTVFLENLQTPLLTVPFSFENGGTQLTGGNTGGLGLVNGTAWVGFTSATRPGTASQFAELRSWTWNSFRLPDACYTGNVGVGSGGPYDLLTINGSAGGFFRTTQLAIADPFTIGIAPPPGVASAPYALVATIGLADGTTVTPTPYGTACFPLALAIDLGNPLAPHSVAIPPGIVLPFPLTLQALMAPDAANPSLVQLTNAIGLQFSLAPAPSISGITPNSVAAGATVTINGSNFSPFVTVDINGSPLVLQSVTSSQIRFAAPAGVACAASVRVRNPDGAQALGTYNPNPTITNQVNATGPFTGGTSYVAIGTGFAAGCTATIGGVPAVVSSSSSVSIVIITPPNTPGPKPVVITTPGGCTVTGTFTYF
ncbi:MAG: IPT/TIG domain-containing protein [Planctomycetes bacterium]|jgi:hypothetical protein|nr:IPT/TIG domain-containing protein [Planctomycetota bacterium]